MTENHVKGTWSPTEEVYEIGGAIWFPPSPVAGDRAVVLYKNGARVRDIGVVHVGVGEAVSVPIRSSVDFAAGDCIEWRMEYRP